MIPFFKYHPESGTVIARLVVTAKDDLQHHNQDGYAFLLAPQEDSTLRIWIDPLTKESHQTIDYTLPHSRMAVIGEEFEAQLPAPCWVQIAGELPIFLRDGKLNIQFAETRSSFSLAGAYNSNVCFIFWKTLDQCREEAKAKIDAEAEKVRESLQTPGSGQAMTYLRKADAARAHIAGFPISAAQLARLVDEAERLEISIDAAAQRIVDNADAWEARDSEIDTLRLVNKSAVNAATTGSDIQAILDNLTFTK